MNLERRIVVIGRTGNGKSATANSLLDREAFVTKPSSACVTTKSQLHESDLCGIKLCVVDTPGLFDDVTTYLETAIEIQLSVDILGKAPHAFLIVMSITNRFSPEEVYAVDILRTMFGDSLFDHAVVVFTSKSALGDRSLQEFYSANPKLTSIVSRCKGGCIAIENTGSKEGIDGLYQRINTLSENGTKVYQDDLKIHKRVLEDLKSSGTTYYDYGIVLNETLDKLNQLRKGDSKWKQSGGFNFAVGVASGVIVSAVAARAAPTASLLAACKNLIFQWYGSRSGFR